MQINIVRSYYDKEGHGLREERVKEITDKDRPGVDVHKEALDYIKWSNEPMHFYYEGSQDSTFPGNWINALYLKELRKLQAENQRREDIIDKGGAIDWAIK